ncbi:trace amine-associated receptor 7h-like [Nematostella vectensis]|uniref:trace amine-associated receptor 7h-like n=1 Tax=Nematostella vectensis TaxID=45351 RepID=UPI002077430E|nr:trace amine-associated receptor 7h-like [Nematostella vectensis]
MPPAMEATASNHSSTRRCFFLVYDHQRILLARDAYIAAAVINCITMFPAIILNVLLMRAMSSSPVLRKPSTLLLYSLSASDLLLGLIVQPGYIAKKVGELTDNFDLYCRNAVIIYNIGSVLTGVLFLTITAISIDRYLLVTSGIEYPMKVTGRRVLCVIVIMWLFMVMVTSSQYFISRSVCFLLTAITIGSCVAMTTACYTKALYTIRQQKAAIKSASGPTSQVQANTARYRKYTHTMIWMFVIFLFCYTPFMLTSAVASFGTETASIWSAEALCGVIAYCNSCFNPAIMFWRVGELQNAGRNILKARSRSQSISVTTTTKI